MQVRCDEYFHALERHYPDLAARKFPERFIADYVISLKFAFMLSARCLLTVEVEPEY